MELTNIGSPQTPHKSMFFFFNSTFQIDLVLYSAMPFFPTIWNGLNRPKQFARGRISPFADGSGKTILEGTSGSARVVGHEHQVDDWTSDGYVEPNGIDDASEPLVPDEVIRVSVDEGQKDEGKAQGSQSDV